MTPPWDKDMQVLLEQNNKFSQNMQSDFSSCRTSHLTWLRVTWLQNYDEGNKL